MDFVLPSRLMRDGLYDRDFTVLGNNFTLGDVAGVDCNAEGWTVIDGSVLINGHNATFRNVAFAGPVEIRGNNPRRINDCFGDTLIVFGNDVQIEEQPGGRSRRLERSHSHHEKLRGGAMLNRAAACCADECPRPQGNDRRAQLERHRGYAQHLRYLQLSPGEIAAQVGHRIQNCGAGQQGTAVQGMSAHAAEVTGGHHKW
jgi:hypothetical protein